MILLNKFTLGIDDNLKWVLIIIMAGVSFVFIISKYLKYRLEWKEMKLRYQKDTEKERVELMNAKSAYEGKLKTLSNETTDKK